MLLESFFSCLFIDWGASASVRGSALSNPGSSYREGIRSHWLSAELHIVRLPEDDPSEIQRIFPEHQCNNDLDNNLKKGFAYLEEELEIGYE